MLLMAIRKGIKAPLSQTPAPSNPTHQLQANHKQHFNSLMETIGEYCQTGAVRALTNQGMNRTRYWVPIFARPKKDSTKIRLITDLRELNKCHSIQHHKPHTWTTLLQTLREPGLTWGLKLDLKGYYHHHRMHKQTQRWMRFKLGTKVFHSIHSDGL